MKKISFKALITAATVASAFLGLPGCGGKAQDSGPDENFGDSLAIDELSVDTTGLIDSGLPGEGADKFGSPMPSTEKRQAHDFSHSAEYDEGHHKGYVDGEDDAISMSGYHAQYSSRNDYKGQKDFDYREGYDDGYEAGYYDNLSRE